MLSKTLNLVLSYNFRLTGFERSAIGEGIASHISGAGTDGRKTTEVTFGVGSTGVNARVDASIVDTGGLVAGTFAVRCAFSATDPVRIAMVTLLDV